MNKGCLTHPFLSLPASFITMWVLRGSISEFCSHAVIWTTLTLQHPFPGKNVSSKLEIEEHKTRIFKNIIVYLTTPCICLLTHGAIICSRMNRTVHGKMIQVIFNV